MGHVVAQLGLVCVASIGSAAVVVEHDLVDGQTTVQKYQMSQVVDLMAHLVCVWVGWGESAWVHWTIGPLVGLSRHTLVYWHPSMVGRLVRNWAGQRKGHAWVVDRVADVWVDCWKDARILPRAQG